ncbi:MAG: polysaccharide biosynthesis tyrosine autokinase [Kiritimatiellia bacterium]
MERRQLDGRKAPEEETQIDFRLYLAVVLFRWKWIAVFFLYALLAGVIYLQVAPKRYQSRTEIMIYRDPLLAVSREGAQWTNLRTHVYMLSHHRLHERVVQRLSEQWADKVGGRARMFPRVLVSQGRGVNPMVVVVVQSHNRDYTRAFLEMLVNEHQQEWQSVQRQARNSAGEMLERELLRLDQQIRAAEDDLIEYQRLHDIARVEARGTMESRYLVGLMQRRNQLMTEIMLLEAQNPQLQEANASVISDVARLTRETGQVRSVEDIPDDVAFLAERDVPVTPEQNGEARDDAVAGFQGLRVRLLQLQEEEAELSVALRDDNPRLRDLRNEIQRIERQLRTMAEVQMRNLQDRHQALLIQLGALETAEYQWQARNLMASQRQAEYRRLQSMVSRLVTHYNTLYGRLHDMRVSEELKAEHFIPEDVRTRDEPIWPDPMKILSVALAAGLGGGFGLAFLLQMLDNKVHSIKDVEKGLGIPFLGGIPYWAHSGLESTIRPIVTEEHSTGAIEAYRALRTSILTALKQKNEKILLVTSADSREGKTLTTLNMAIMVAQMGKRVLLVDMDLRRGRIHRSLGLERDPGVADALREGFPLKNAVQKSRIENLDVAPSGSDIDDSAELLQTIDLQKFFFSVYDDYDYIFVDTSPVLRVTDPVILASQGIGQVLYVARVGFTPKPMLRYSLDMLKDANILGMVMNSIEMHRISSLYYAYQYPNYAYYSNAYTYGYNYYYYDDKRGGGQRHAGRGGIRARFQRMHASIRNAIFPSV